MADAPIRRIFYIVSGSILLRKIGGANRNRTGVRGFADHCLTTRPSRHISLLVHEFNIAVYVKNVFSIRMFLVLVKYEHALGR